MVVECEGKNATDSLQERRKSVGVGGGEGCSPLSVKSKDDLAVAARLKLISASKLFSDFLMIIDFAIHGKHLFAIGRKQRLLTTFGVHNTQSLVRQDG